MVAAQPKSGVDMNSRENPQYALYYKALDADSAYSAKLHELFGDKAGHVRYTTKGKGELGSELRQLHDEFMRATTPKKCSRNCCLTYVLL